LLQCASPDAIARLPATKLKHDAEELWTEYFRNQKHGSLKEYLVHCLGSDEDTENDSSLVQVSFLILTEIALSHFSITCVIVVNACRLLFQQRNWFKYLVSGNDNELSISVW
jgi:hypothetical protein